MRRHLRMIPILVVASLLAAACTGDDDSTSSAADGGSDDAATATEPPPPCQDDLLDDAETVALQGTDPTETSVTVANSTHRCAETVVLAPADGGWSILLAASVAVQHDAPLILVDAALPEPATAAINDLEPDEVIAVGGDLPGATRAIVADPVDGTATGGTATEPSEMELALAVAEDRGTDRYLAVLVDDLDARASLGSHLPDTALLPLPSVESAAGLAGSLPDGATIDVLATDPAAREALLGALRNAGLTAQSVEPDTTTNTVDTAWLADPADAGAFGPALVAAATRDEPVLGVDATDLRNSRARTTQIAAAEPRRAVLVGEMTEHADWQLAVVRRGDELPGGGFRLFEGTIMVALYGHVNTTALGAMGEQDLDATVVRAREVAAPYGADGLTPLPAFEMIVTVAHSSAGPQGDYSVRADIEDLRPWVERAADEGFYVVLDLQPGHTDFLTQAQEFEELLLYPHVGLALDPEWRLEPHQRHLQQIGSVSAAEVQSVADWLAELTRENELPEKLLILHQFRHDMLPDRDTIVAPPELAVVVHMDGQGPIGTKYDTYNAITTGHEDRWLWGWKNFYDEDFPTPTPAEVLALDPLPVFVSYQ